MNLKVAKRLALPLALASVVMLSACAKKKVAQTPPTPPPPPPTAPSASISASPDSIRQGQATTLSWQTQNADTVTIAGLGTVPASGSREVRPGSSTTYTLTAQGPGGSQQADARVTVTAAPVAQQTPVNLEELFSQNVKDVFFDYDKYAVTSDEQAIIDRDAKFLADHPQIKFVIEGHCDERGSEEYNLALGDNRAGAVRKLLDQMGVTGDRIKVVSYGKEKPFCTDENEQCWSQNRRAHFVLQNGNQGSD